MFKRTKPIIIILVLVFLVGACIKDELNMNRFSKRMEINPGLALPVGYGTLTISDLLKKYDTTGGFKVGIDSLLYMIYSTEFLSFPADTILSLPDQVYNQFFIKDDLPGPITDSAGGFTLKPDYRNPGLLADLR